MIKEHLLNCLTSARCLPSLKMYQFIYKELNKRNSINKIPPTAKSHFEQHSPSLHSDLNLKNRKNVENK
jgi:hypothetical protein